MIKSYKLRRHIANAFVYLFLIVMGFIWISPFIYLLMHSFRGGAEIYGSTIIPQDRKSTRLNSSHITRSRMPSSA